VWGVGQTETSLEKVVDGGARWRKGNIGGERGHGVSGSEDRALEDHMA
jgi:hypothetical protein